MKTYTFGLDDIKVIEFFSSLGLRLEDSLGLLHDAFRYPTRSYIRHNFDGDKYLISAEVDHKEIRVLIEKLNLFTTQK